VVTGSFSWVLTWSNLGEFGEVGDKIPSTRASAGASTSAKIRDCLGGGDPRRTPPPTAIPPIGDALIPTLADMGDLVTLVTEGESLVTKGDEVALTTEGDPVDLGTQAGAVAERILLLWVVLPSNGDLVTVIPTALGSLLGVLGSYPGAPGRSSSAI
jgi:hypothetical protein